MNYRVPCLFARKFKKEVFPPIRRIMFATKARLLVHTLQRTSTLTQRAAGRTAVYYGSKMRTMPISFRAFATIPEQAEQKEEATKEVKSETTQTTNKLDGLSFRKVTAGFTIGFVASALGSMAGLGGGFIIIPLLTSFGGMSQHQAAACSLASICVNAISGTATYISQGLIDIPAAAAITATSMIMARFGSKWSHKFDSKKLKKYYGWLCLLVAPLIPLKNRIMQKRKEEERQKSEQMVVDNLEEENAKLGYHDCLSMDAMKRSEAVNHTPLLLSLGLAAGSMSGFFGVGGGIIVSPSLCLFTQMVPKKIMGTSLVGN